MQESAANSKVRWVLLRGWTREARHWHHFPKILSDLSGDEIITLDLPGVGTENTRPSPSHISEIAADVRSRWFLHDAKNAPPGSALPVKIPTYCIGISMGGMVALDWCTQWPEDFSRLVLINSSLASLSPPWQRPSGF